AYEEYQFHRQVHAVNQLTLEVSAVYLDVLKDELYCGAPDGRARRAAQTVLYHLADTLARLLAPVLVFTADEVWERLPARTAESVRLADWREPRPEWLDDVLAADFDVLLAARDVVKKG